LELQNSELGTIKRSSNLSKCRIRYEYLKDNKNINRITRILISLGDLGFLHFQKPLINHFFDEIFLNSNFLNFKDTFFNVWIKMLNEEFIKEINEKIITINQQKNKEIEKEKKNEKNKKKFSLFSSLIDKKEIDEEINNFKKKN
jgi:hypothetical protein